MAYLVDTNVLLRLVNVSDAQHALASRAVTILHGQRETLHVTAQNLIEFRNGATRPLQSNGLGLPPVVAAQEAAKLEVAFPLLEETPDVYPAWKTLADPVGAVGKQVHDTRLVAVCHVHNVTHILTFNVRDFLRFQNIGPGLVVVDPHTV